jgi:ankyrin repeat protein
MNMRMPKPPRQRMFDAVFSGHTHELQAALGAGAKVNDVNEDGLSPLQLAAKLGRKEVAGLLIKEGADINAATSRHDETALMIAVGQRWPEVAQLLIGAGANVNAATDEGVTALHTASHNQDMIAALIKAGANVAAVDDDGRTPLHWVSTSVKPECCRLLIEAGANIHAQDSEGVTPFQMATGRGNEDLLRPFLARQAEDLRQQLERNTAQLPDLNDPAVWAQNRKEQAQRPKRRGVRL